MAVQDPSATDAQTQTTESDKDALVSRFEEMDGAERPHVNERTGNVIVAFYDGVPHEFFKMLNGEEVTVPFNHKVYLVDDYSVDYKFVHEEA